MRAHIEALRCLHYLNSECIDLSRRHPDESVRAARAELTDLLTPISKAWGTELGVEVTSLALQVHGGMGYIEETGVAQHYRDIRIAPIYEGTNGIQAIDLVGRKLGLRAGDAIRGLLTAIDGTAAEATASGGELAVIGESLADAAATMRDTTEWLLAHGAEPRDALAGASPFLRMAGLVVGGWLLTRSALAATRLADAGDGRFTSEFLHQKVVTARFYATQLLPQAAGLAPAVTAGAADLFAAAF